MHQQHGSGIVAMAKKGVFLMALFAAVLFVNVSVLRYDMMYIEQPTVYFANQTIHSWGDLLNVYLHPKLLDSAIPFFRPSGHFLIYQLIMPLLGWHNTRGMLAVNLFFLALTGYVMIRLYQLLFPHFKMGGYIAFGVYAMQPALILSRLTVMHFEFAYVFFLVLSLYYFVLFCKKNYLLETSPYYTCRINKIRLDHLRLLAISLFAFVIAVTFKEPALMLGPVLVSYLVIALYHPQSTFQFIEDVMSNKQVLQIIVLVTITSIVLAMYLTLPWPSLTNPDRPPVRLAEISGCMKEFGKIIFSMNQNVSSEKGLYAPGMVLRYVELPLLAHCIMWFLFIGTAAAMLLLARDRAVGSLLWKKSLFFLGLSSVLFLVLPVLWAAGLPWHLSLSLLCISLVVGFGLDYLLSIFLKDQRLLLAFGALFILFVAVAAFQVNQVNIRHLAHTPEGFNYLLNRNAVLHPPAIQAELNDQSVVVVEDSLAKGDYVLGNGGYPFFLLGDGMDYDLFKTKQQYHYVQYQPQYNGTLFRWAYLMPQLQEEYYPFEASNMRNVMDLAIYKWLLHYDNIFCLGYDKSGNWFDHTAIFKKNLLLEKKRRHLVLERYRTLPVAALVGRPLYTKKATWPDPELCQSDCDQDARCKGFTYIQASIDKRVESKCHFYRSMASDKTKPCAVCTGFIKSASYPIVSTASVLPPL